MSGNTQIIPPDEIQSAIEKLAAEVTDRHKATESLAIIAIADGGIPFANLLGQCIRQSLGRKIAVGSVDISFHRDDLGRNPIPKPSSPTEIPVEMDGATILLVDDVLFTGRSVRAAINEIFDLGRPGHIELVILFDRGGRKLPINPDYIGFQQQLSTDNLVEVHIDPDNPDNHSIRITKDSKEST